LGDKSNIYEENMRFVTIYLGGDLVRVYTQHVRTSALSL